MSCNVKIVADSLAPNGVRLTTFECEYPRFIHSEVMTHRQISRNGRSSRAEPLTRVLERVLADPVEPLVWMFDKKGMEPGDPMPDCDLESVRNEWLRARDNAVTSVRRLAQVGLHRQYAARLIEPFAKIKVLMSATSWDNFFNLRLDRRAMPEFQQLAVRMAKSYRDATPEICRECQWHLPYITDRDRDVYPIDTLIRISVARCARVSYDSPKLGESCAKDIDLYNRLVGSDPKHLSPAEHQAQSAWSSDFRSANFRGWRQYRQAIDTPSNFDLSARLAEYEGVDYLL